MQTCLFDSIGALAAVARSTIVHRMVKDGRPAQVYHRLTVTSSPLIMYCVTLGSPSKAKDARAYFILTLGQLRHGRHIGTGDI